MPIAAGRKSQSITCLMGCDDPLPVKLCDNARVLFPANVTAASCGSLALQQREALAAVPSTAVRLPASRAQRGCGPTDRRRAGGPHHSDLHWIACDSPHLISTSPISPRRRLPVRTLPLFRSSS
jgi:hypothetical protein